VVGTYCWFFVRHCGSRPGGELLFVSSHKEEPEKAATSATPLKSRGSRRKGFVIMLRQNSQKTLRQLSQKAHVNKTLAMAC
jgi:hypothetical protein